MNYVRFSKSVALYFLVRYEEVRVSHFLRGNFTTTNNSVLKFFFFLVPGLVKAKWLARI